MNKTALFLILFVLAFAFAQELQKPDLALQEESIFSKEGELDLPKITAKDTTVDGYRERIGRVKARIEQVDGEIKTIINELGNTYPALEPQKPDETLQDFENRKSVWHNEGMRQYTELQKKYEAYKSNLVRSIEVLEDNIKMQSLDLNYAPKDENAKEEAVAQAMLTAQASSKDSGGGLGWRGWTRIATYTLAAGFASAAAVKQFSKVDKYKGNIEDLDNSPNRANYKQWRNMYKENVENVNKYEKQRNFYIVGAGGLLVAGTLTFLF